MNTILTNIRFIPLTILVGVQHQLSYKAADTGFIPLTILVGVQPQILLEASCAIFLTE